MEKRYTWKPNYAVPPGGTLQETMRCLHVTQADLAKRTGLLKKTIYEIIRGEAAITPETALQLEKVLGVPASLWLGLERNYKEAMRAMKPYGEAVRALEPKIVTQGHTDYPLVPLGRNEQKEPNLDA
jgi:addiction module HigA family antidote